jgi:hypothetical protein
MKRAAIILGALLAADMAWAKPPLPPALDDLAKRSDLIAVVRVTNVVQQIGTRVSWREWLPRREKWLYQSAVATVASSIKGKCPPSLLLTHEEAQGLSCSQPHLGTGEYLVFLRWDGAKAVRTDLWYSQAVIVSNKVSVCFAQAVPLESVVADIERVVGER